MDDSTTWTAPLYWLYYMSLLFTFLVGFGIWFALRFLWMGLYTVDQNERAVKTSFGRAERLNATTLEDPIAQYLRERKKTY